MKVTVNIGEDCARNFPEALRFARTRQRVALFAVREYACRRQPKPLT